jgi:nitrogen regulatory protein PII
MKKDRIGVIAIDTLFFTIVNRGKANAVLRKAKDCGATGGTIFLGEGTIQSKLLEKIGVNEIHKEILMISASNELNDKLHEALSETFTFTKRNKGIAFSIPFKRWTLEDDKRKPKAVLDDDKYSSCCIFTIVDKGRSRDCITAARAAGARGGTVVHGHGAGVPTDYYFPLVIEPRKDTVMIVTSKDKAASVRERIFSDLELDKPGNGIIFTLPVGRTSGLFENRTEERKGVTA